jgi:purine-binding chemotaxis protein CheW
MPEERQYYCTFFLDGLFLGVDVLKVQEVIRYQEMTRVPLSPGVISGLINLRGQIVTAIDLRRRLRLPDRHPNPLPMNVILRTGDGPVSLLVDEIEGVREVDEESFERPPGTLDVVARDLIQGVYKLKDRLLLILDIDKAISVDGLADSAPKRPPDHAAARGRTTSSPGPRRGPSITSRASRSEDREDPCRET